MDSIAELYFTVIEKISAYRNLILFGIGVLLLSTGVVWWQSSRRASISRGAHAALLELEKLTHAEVGDKATTEGAMLFPSEEEKWAAVQVAADRSHADFAGSKLAAFFLAYRADALTVLGKKDEARELLARAVASMPMGDIRDLYEIKLALFQLDMAEPQAVTQGIARLQKIANKDRSAAQPVALYRLGEYYWILNDFNEAKNYFGQLSLMHGRKIENQLGSIEPLPWATKAQSRLNLIASA